MAWRLTDAGYRVVLDVWDWAAGRNFVTAMSDALDRCDRVVALFSAAYFERDRYTTEEWSAAVLHVLGIEQTRLVPVRVEDVPAAQIPAVLRPLMARDIFGLAEEQARQVLLEAVASPQRPTRKPPLPQPKTSAVPGERRATAPRLPGDVPPVWNIPARNPGFTGRDGLLVAIREELLAGDKAVVQALEGMGGVGKTQLAIEYAHQFAGIYDLVWWVNAEQAGLIGEQFAALGAELGWVEAGAGTEAVRTEVLRRLRGLSRWLLVFDNATDPDDVRPWLPGGSGHVLVTSRERNWAEIAVPVEIDVLARPESVAILCHRVAGLGEADAARLAVQLGDLPLALAQAAGYMASTGMPAARYLDLLQTKAGQLLDQARPVSYPRSLAAATQLAADRLAEEDPPAAELAGLCAFLAPEPIPEDLFTAARGELPGELAARAADPLAWPQTLARLARQALARIDQRGLVMHRLTQAILRGRLVPSQAVTTRECAEAILAASNPRDPSNPVTWPRWAQLMPHLLAVDLAATGNLALRWMACDACAYLVARGDTRIGRDLAHDLRQHWRERLGPDDQEVRMVTSYLGWALREMDCYAEARELDQENLDHSRRILGEDHRDTLVYASDLASDLRALGEVRAARDLEEDTLDRSRRVLGEDDPDTLTSANNLANDLFNLGELQAARDLYRDTVNRCRRVLSEDHPDTLRFTGNLAMILRALGEVQAARDLDQDVLDRFRRVLGEDHPDTLRQAENLAADLRALEKAEDEPRNRHRLSRMFREWRVLLRKD